MDYGTGFPNVVVAAVACHVQTKTCEDSQQPKGIEPTINLEYTFHGDKVSRNFLFLFPHGFDAVAYFLESLEQRRNIGFGGIEGDRDGFGLEVTNEIFHSFLKGYILHDLIAAALAVQVAGKDNYLFVRLGSIQRRKAKGERRKEQ